MNRVKPSLNTGTRMHYVLVTHPVPRNKHTVSGYKNQLVNVTYEDIRLSF
jgi:hypothetical protein